jgi:hypothetical protein
MIAIDWRIGEVEFLVTFISMKIRQEYLTPRRRVQLFFRVESLSRIKEEKIEPEV